MEEVPSHAAEPSRAKVVDFSVDVAWHARKKHGNVWLNKCSFSVGSNLGWTDIFLVGT